MQINRGGVQNCIIWKSANKNASFVRWSVSPREVIQENAIVGRDWKNLWSIMVMTFLHHSIFHYVLISHVPSRHHRNTKMNKTNPIEIIFRRMIANIVPVTYICASIFMWHLSVPMLESLPLDGWSRKNQGMFLRINLFPLGKKFVFFWGKNTL